MKNKIVLIASLIAGLVAACLTRLYLAAKEAEVREILESYRANYGEMWALCYKRDIPTGTVLSWDDFKEMQVPEFGMKGRVVTKEDLHVINGRKTVCMGVKNKVVFWSDIDAENPHDKGLSSDIDPDMRAVSINCSGAAAVSSMVKPGDHVDVIGTFELAEDNGQKKLVTCTILQRVLVLATGNKTAKDLSRNLGAGSAYNAVTLQVTPREAEMLAFAEQIRGRLILTLRNSDDNSFESELPEVNFDKIRSELKDLNDIRNKKD